MEMLWRSGTESFRCSVAFWLVDQFDNETQLPSGNDANGPYKKDWKNGGLGIGKEREVGTFYSLAKSQHSKPMNIGDRVNAQKISPQWQHLFSLGFISINESASSRLDFVDFAGQERKKRKYFIYTHIRISL